MVDVDVPERDGGPCPYCGFALELVYPTHGIRYWTCSAEPRRRRRRSAPEIVGWAAALVSVQITEVTIRRSVSSTPMRPTRRAFFDRLCDRIEVNRATCRDKETRSERRGWEGAG